MDIIVTMPKEKYDIEHLIEKIEDSGPWWRMEGYRPVDLQVGDRVFICYDGIVRGFFRVDSWNWEGKSFYINFLPGSFRHIKPIKMDGFMRFRLRNFDFETVA